MWSLCPNPCVLIRMISHAWEDCVCPHQITFVVFVLLSKSWTYGSKVEHLTTVVRGSTNNELEYRKVSL